MIGRKVKKKLLKKKKHGLASYPAIQVLLWLPLWNRKK